jgi:hypothetical protein
MHTKEELISKYERYSDNELLEMQANLHDYSDEAREAFRIVISKKGGEENLEKIRERNLIVQKETRRIIEDVNKLTTADIDISFLKRMITSDIIDQSELDKIIEAAYQNAKSEIEDTEVKPATIMGSIFGGIVASITGGIFMGLQLIYSPRIFYIIIFGQLLLCYWIVYLFARKSYKNQSVIIATIVSFVLTFFVGKFIFLLVGYHG